MSEPTLPYVEVDGTATAGHAGSDTSRERAEREARDGTVGARQRKTLDLLSQARVRGLTWKDLSDATGWHHGQSSGVLSVLHKTGAIERLAARRDRCLIYVSPEYVGDRPISATKITQRMVDNSVLTEKDEAVLARCHQALGRANTYCCVDRNDMVAVLAMIETRLV